MKKLIYIYALFLLSSCAINQSIDLLGDASIANTDKIEFVDERDQASTTTRLNTSGVCSRWYGDQFITPSKMDYMHYVLAKEYEGNEEIRITIKELDTIEYCGDTAKRVETIATFSAPSRAAHHYKLPHKAGEDYFRLHISGEKNGEPFVYTSDFIYSDLSYLNFPSENPEYINRIENSFAEAAEYILSVSQKGHAQSPSV